MKRNLVHIVLSLIMVLSWTQFGASQEPNQAQSSDQYNPRLIPSKEIPVPSTVSPELKQVISRPLEPVWNLSPATKEEWHALVDQKSKMNVALFSKLVEKFPVVIDSITIGGANAQLVTPHSLPESNTNRILIHLRGGGYVFNGGEAGIGEAVLMAYHGGFRVISIDYRMAPDHPYPAALEDAVNAYMEIVKTYKPGRVAIFGTSAGGGLAAATILKLQELGAPLPRAVGLGTPWADLTKTGDTFFTNEYIDDVLVMYEGLLEACAKIYAGGNDIKDKYISPVYAEYTKQFPPTILTTGTRDLFLSDTVRIHRKLRKADVMTELQISEGMSHAQYVMAFDSPESKEVFEGIAKFFDKNLER